MKIHHRSALGLVLLVSFSTAKIIPTSEPITSGTEKKIHAQEEPAKPEAPQAIAVEDAEEPKQADRTKKSATTTFCVEIRPGPSDGPVKAYDEHNPLPPPPPPPPPHPAQAESQIHSDIPPPHSPPQELHHEEQEQFPVFVIPPNPFALYIPNEGQSLVNYPPHILHHNNQLQVPGNPQHIIIPSSSSQQIIFSSGTYPSVASPSQPIIIPSGSYPSVTSPSQPIIIPSGSYPSIASPSQHIVVPSGTSQQVVIPPGTSQHVIVPSTGSGLCPCQSTTNGLYPHTLVSLFRSAMGQNSDGGSGGDGDNVSPGFMDPGMEMRSGNSGDWMPGINSGSLLTDGGMAAAPNQMPYGSESLDAPFARTHTKKIYAVPVGSYYGSGAGGYQAKSPYVVQCNPQILALGGPGGAGGGSTIVLNSPTLRDAEGNPDINNMENPGARNIEQSLPINDAQMRLGTSAQGGRHVIHPIIQPIIHTTTPGATFHSSPPSVYQHSSTYQTYQSRPMYPSHDPAGYMVHPGSHFYRREGAPQQLRAWNTQPAANMQQRIPSSDTETQQQFEGKSWNQQTANMERSASGTSAQQHHQKGLHSGAMSPSQMLNHMRGVGSSGSGSSSFGRTSPVMQTFPREHEESPCKEGVHVSMHLPSGGQPVMVTAPRNEKNMEMNHGGAIHDEMGKREAEKSAVSEIDA